MNPPAGLEAGRVIGDYELIEEIARGGMGVVFKARQKNLDRLVALKMIRAGWLARSPELARFRAEARAVAGLQHPNIVAIHEVGEHDGQPFFSMEFVAGRTLDEIVREQPLTATRAARYLQQVAEAIQHAHERGVLHRDLKPSNVLIDAEDRPRVTDFGLAKRLEGDPSLTLTGQVLGSPSFMPPEQASSRHGKIGTASDVYSLGALLYHALTGRPPFVGDTIAATLRLVVEAEPVAPRVLLPTLPQDLETICLKCLSKESSRRYQTARELAEDLAHFLRKEPICARPASVAEKTWRWGRRKPAQAAALLLLLVIAVGSPLAALRINQARRQADESRAKESQLRQHAEQLTEQSRQRLYAARINLAAQALETGEIDRVKEVLESLRPESGEEDLRGFEWHHLWHLSHREEVIFLGHKGVVQSVAFSVDGSTVASGGSDNIVRIWNSTTGEETMQLGGHEGAVMPITEWNTGSSFRLRFEINTPSAGQTFVQIIDTVGTSHSFNGPLVQSNQLQHMVMTYDRGTERLTIYRNGVVGADYTGVGNFSPQTSTNLYIGHRPPSTSFKGLIDEVTIYNRALSAEEVMAQYEAYPTGKSYVRPYFMTESPLPYASWQVGYMQQIVAVLGVAPLTYTITAGTLPTGLTLSTNGVISGVATEVGTKTLAIRATDELGYWTEREYEIEAPQHFWPEGMVSWWRAETNGLDWLGLNNGTLFAGVAFTNGAFGRGFLFNGTTGQVVKAVASESLNVGSGAGLTVEGWIRPNSFTQKCIAEWNSGSASGTGVNFFHSTLSGGGGIGGLYANFLDTNLVNHFLVTPANILSTNVLQHIGFTYDRTSGVARIYLNGVVVTNANLGVFTPRTVNDFNLGGARTNAGFFDGQMDEMALYNRALDASEMLAIYQNSPATKSQFGPFIITTNLLSTGIVGAFYSQTIVARSITNPLSMVVSSGALPPGLVLSSGGLLSGSPTNAGVFNFMVQATDAGGISTSKEFTLEVIRPLPPPPGIVAWWQAESNALDSIGTSHGTLLNGATYTNGNVGTAFSFDGVNDYATFPDAPALRPTSLTVETWVKLSATSGTRFIWSKPVGGALFNSFGLHMLNGVLRGYIGNTNGNGTATIPSFALTTGRWYHLAFTYDGSSGMQGLFVDGVLVTNVVTDRTFINYDASPVVIGAELDNGAPTFYVGGQIDEPTIYNRALSESEIAATYAAGNFGKAVTGPYFVTNPELPPALAGQAYTQAVATARATAPVTYSLVGGTLPLGLTLNTNGTISGTTASLGDFTFAIRATDATSLTGEQAFTMRVAAVPPLAGLVGWWRAEASGLDSIGNSHGVLSNGTTYAEGKVGQSFRFDGTNDTVEIPDVIAQHPASVTLEAWIVAEATNGARQIFAKPFGGGVLNSVALYLTNGILTGFVGDGITNGIALTNYAAVIPGRWYHVAYTFDAVNQEQSLYVDGALVGSDTPGRYISLAYDAQPLILGADIQNGSRTFYFKGRIDEPAIYNRALSSDEIAALYGSGSVGRDALGPYLNTSPVLPGGGVNQPYLQTLTSARATGGVSYTLVAGSLPSGLTLATNGIIGGVPTVAGGFAFTVRVTDSLNQIGEQQFVLMINDPAEWPTGMIAWWRAETNALDAIGVNHGTLTNGTTFSVGKVGQAFSFDGTNDFVQIADATNLRPASLTFEAWIYPTATNGNRMIFAKSAGSGTLDSIGVFLTNGILRGQVGNTTNNSGVVSSPTTLVPGRWYHIAYTFNHSMTQQVLYVDSLYAAGNTADRQMVYDAGPVLLGADINSGTPGFFFAGLIDEPTFYNRALTALEIKGLYEGDVAGKRLPTPFEQWSLQYFGNVTASTSADSDNDGFDNLSEFTADTNPTNAASLLRLTQVDPQGAEAVISWQGGILATQVLQNAVSLETPNSWTDLFTNLPPTTEFSAYTNAFGTNTKKFYRVRAIR